MESRQPPGEVEPAGQLQLDTPVIDLQDLTPGHGPQKRAREARVSELPQLDLSREDEKARQAIEEFERSLKEQPPG